MQREYLELMSRIGVGGEVSLQQLRMCTWQAAVGQTLLPFTSVTGFAGFIPHVLSES